MKMKYFVIVALLISFIIPSSYAINIDYVDGGSINSDITLNVPSDYISINNALDALTSHKIDRNVIVTIQIADGTYTSSAIEIEHPNGSQIHIIGNTTNNNSVVINFNNGENGFAVKNGNKLGFLDGVTLVGNNQTGYGLYAFGSGNISCGENISISNFNRGLFATSNSHIFCIGIAISYSGDNGITCDSGSVVRANNSIITNSGGMGVMVSSQSLVNVSGATISSNSRSGAAADMGSVIIADNLTSQSNGEYGVTAHGGSNVRIRFNYLIQNNSLGSYSPSANTVGNYNSYINIQ